MAFKFSLGAAKANKAQLNAKAKAEDEAKEREEKLALEKVMAEFEEEHSAENSVLGDSARDHGEEQDVFVPTGNKRHFTGRQRSMKSGPGTLEPEQFDGFPRPGGAGRLGPQMQSRFGSSLPSAPAAVESPKSSENVYTTLVAKASNLPPAIDTQRVEALFADFPSLKVTKVEKIPPHGPTARGRSSATMKVVFDKEAVARDLDDAMMKLNDKKYLGRGYYLHLDRYLGGKVVETAQKKEAFGARWQAPEVSKGYAPPPDLGGGSRDGPREDRDQLIVTANQPPDLPTLRIIHQTIEGVIQGGMEFEAALMNDPQVQDEERFAWLFDQKHPLNRYYRWRMHQLVCDTPNSEIFAHHGHWNGPTDPLADEFADSLGAFDPMDDDSNSDDEDERPQHKPLPVGDTYPGRVDNGYGILSPRSRAMLVWMITMLPPGSIVADDIAAISLFAVQHASQGLDEIVHILLTNVIEPLQLSEANSKRHDNAENKDDIRRPDTRQVTLNALRIVHDVLFTTSKEAGATYKYRNAIGIQLVDRKVFEHLEQLPTQLEMGRMTERSYRDEVNVILKVWEDEAFFEKATLQHLQDVFNARERQKEHEEHERKLAERRKRKVAPKTTATSKTAAGKQDEDEDMAVDEEERTEEKETDDVDNAVQVSSEETMSMPVDDESEATQVQAKQEDEAGLKPAPMVDEIPGETAAARARRLRPKAEDMFASDEE